MLKLSQLFLALACCVTLSLGNVIIIGSGISGLTAANELIKNNKNDFLVLEAQGRIGGRTYTTAYGNNFIEIGAQWIHGRNLLYTFAKSIGILDEATKTVNKRADSYYSTQDGSSLDESLVEQIMDELEELVDELDDDIESLNSDQSFQSVLDKKFNKYLSTKKSTQIELVRAVYGATLKEEKFGSACDPLDYLSAMGWNEFEDSSGDDMINLKGGYASLVNYFVARISQTRIRLNEVVRLIDYSQPQKINVITHNRLTGVQTVYTADQVLVTIPLGYLKMTYKSLFNPPLPTAKANAIEKLGFGTVNKIFLIFNQNFNADTQGVQIMWRRDLGMPQLQSLRRCGIDQSRFYESIGSFEVHPTIKNVLYGFISGNDAIFMESLSDQCLMDVLYELFGRIFPKIITSPPVSVIRSRWANDEFTRGSYSFIRLGSSINDVKKLAEPINSRLFFAGEATNFKYQQTVHGAYQSGLKAAEKIINVI